MNTAKASDLIQEATQALSRARVDSPQLCARLLMAHVLGCSQENLLTHPQQPVSLSDINQFNVFVARRVKGEPLAYLTRLKEFYSLEFLVDQRVLIPRPETEMIVDLVLDRFKPCEDFIFSDIGTGSGALAVSVCSFRSRSLSLACDISVSALHVARINACRIGVAERIMFFLSDLGQGIKAESLDLLISNPPYISEAEFSRISSEVSRFEPYEALVSPQNGMGHLRRLERTARHCLRPGGQVILEMGCSQGDELKAIFDRWNNVQVHKDLAGLDRVLSAEKP